MEIIVGSVTVPSQTVYPVLSPLLNISSDLTFGSETGFIIAENSSVLVGGNMSLSSSGYLLLAHGCLLLCLRLFLLFIIVFSLHTLIPICPNPPFYSTLTILAMGLSSNAEDEGKLSVVGCLQFQGRLVLSLAPLTLRSQNYTV